VITLLIVLGILAAGGTWGVNYWLDSRQYETTDDAFIDGDIIPIGPQIAAKVLDVPVHDNQAVKKGDLLVQLDPTDYQVVLEQKKATEDAARGRQAEARTELEVAQANVGQAEAEVHVAETEAQNMSQDYDRMLGLDIRARSQQQMDNATAAQRSSAATVEQAKAKLAAAQAQVDDATAVVKTAEADAAKAAADREQAEIQLSYCRITAPSDGVVTRKDVEPGMYLSIGQPLLSIVPTDVWVTANYKETQLDDMRPGQKAIISVDAYPETTFYGHLESVQRGTGSKFSLLPAENATGNFVKVVQRVPVKIVLDPGQVDDPLHPLAPGMSAVPKVKVRDRQGLWESLGLGK
jgi:membrane fusion protein, multidrug efflux system